MIMTPKNTKTKKVLSILLLILTRFRAANSLLPPGRSRSVPPLTSTTTTAATAAAARRYSPPRSSSSDDNLSPSSPLSESTPITRPVLQRRTAPSKNKPKPVLVLGATGKIGRIVVRRLLEENVPVRAFCRDYEKALRVLSPSHDNKDGDKNNGDKKAYAYARRRGDVAATLDIIIGDLAPDDDAERAYDGVISVVPSNDELISDGSGASVATGRKEEEEEDEYDLGYEALESAVRGCRGVISCQGTVRRSRPLRDFFFPPWRLFRDDVSRWCRDRRHPYYVNYLASKKLVEFVEREQERQRDEEEAEREARDDGRRRDEEEEKEEDGGSIRHRLTIVRISDLCVGLPAWGFVVVIANLMLSMVFRYQYMAERVLRESNVRNIILRPGDLVDDERDTTKTSLQVCSTGKLPPPSIVGRTDVADLAVSAMIKSQSTQNYTLAVRWAGDDMYPHQSQGVKSDGYDTANKCLEMVEKFTVSSAATTGRGASGTKPYGFFAGVGLYGALVLIAKAFVLPVLKVTRVWNGLGVVSLGVGSLFRRFVRKTPVFVTQAPKLLGKL